jgi:vancomycin permeability regulator SanA
MGFVRRHPVLIALLAAVVVGASVLAATGFAVWQAAHQDDTRRVDRADVVAVLGAAQYSGRPSPTFEARLEHALLLFEKGFAPRVLVLGAGRPGDVTTEAEAGRAWLVDHGVPDDAAFAEPQGNTTLESLEAASTWMGQRDLDTVFRVSDPWHNLRIRRMAGDLGITAMVSATFRSAAKSQWTRLSGYSRETFAYLAYRILGR